MKLQVHTSITPVPFNGLRETIAKVMTVAVQCALLRHRPHPGVNPTKRSVPESLSA
jgi:hypothetical protein